MDAMTQKAMNMTMKEWAHYFENKESRDRILNVISLEFSHTKLGNYVEQPTIVSIKSFFVFVPGLWHHLGTPVGLQLITFFVFVPGLWHHLGTPGGGYN